QRQEFFASHKDGAPAISALPANACHTNNHSNHVDKRDTCGHRSEPKSGTPLTTPSPANGLPQRTNPMGRAPADT
ncbi:hypothetical protein NK983_24005, partial [Salmonella enterica subsp. enterica serovar Typhimurium]|nr:hypothetical protein [Salmonella enterica subsp. enterica serovar Typhimurium]